MTAIMGLAPSNNVDENALEILSQYAEGILLAPKLPPLTLQGPVDIEGLPHFSIGSLSSVVGHYAKGYIPISPWQENQLDSSIRDISNESNLFSTKLKNESQNNNNSKNNIYSSDSDSDSDNDNDDNKSNKSNSNSSSSNDSSSDDNNSSDSDSDSDNDNNDSSSSSDNDSSSSGSDEDDLPPRSQNLSQQIGVESKPGIRKVTGIVRKKQDNDTSKTLIDITSSQIILPNTELSRDYESLDDKFDLLQVNSSLNSNISNNKNPNNSFPMMQSSTPINFTSSSYFPNSPTNSINNTNLIDDNTILAQIMDSFPQSSKSQQSPIINQFNQQNSLLPQQIQPQQQQQQINNLSPSSINTQKDSEEFLSFPKLILRPEIAGSLKVSIIFRHGIRPTTILGSNALFIEITNCSKEYVIRRVRINFPSDLRRTPLEDIPLVSPGETIRLPVEMILRPIVGRSTRIIITSDRGQFNADLLIEMWELLSPSLISNFDFESITKRMGGFCHNTTTMNLPITNLNQQKEKEFSNWMINQIRSKLNISLIQSGSIYDSGSNNNQKNQKDLEWRFSGTLQKDLREDRLLIGISCHSDGKTIINIYSDDAVLSATLFDILKKLLIL